MAQKGRKKTVKQPSHKKMPPKSAVTPHKSQPRKIKIPTWIFIAILITIAAVVVTVLVIKNQPLPSSESALPATITVSEAEQAFSNGAFLLDVRTQEEWESGHIDGAVLIPLDQLESRVEELPTDQDILIICRSGNRSGQARDLLRGVGLSRTTSISGGITAWMAANLPVVTGP